MKDNQEVQGCCQPDLQHMDDREQLVLDLHEYNSKQQSKQVQK